ncbi:unnamed protein product [Paramecium octaurelia]|uniref:Transmembrane protein n=1 Tax=Paramecium octaurelia TaxID=43137 RepID=A0A8S1TSB9_PAROT|nr:unnamed protein product [Paramecium octaurelia]
MADNNDEFNQINFGVHNINIVYKLERLKRNLILIERLKVNLQNLQNRLKIRLSFLILVIISMTYSGLYFLMHQTNQEVYQQFLNNLNQDIIVDLKIEWNEQTCNSPYEPLFEYKYRRVIKGCDCSQIKNITQEQNHKPEIFIDKECTQSNLKQSCFTFSQELYSDLIYLNDNNYGAPFLICAKREKNVSLKNNFTYCKEQEKKICGNKVKYCLPQNLSCPISDFGIANKETLNMSLNYSLINLGNKQVFFFGYDSDRLPISQAYLIKGEKMCKLNSQKAFTEKQILSENQQEVCKEFDNLFQIQYALSEEQLFLSNNLLQFKNELSHFYIDKNHSWTLQAKPFTEIELNCLENEYFENMLNNKYEEKLIIIKSIQIIVVLILHVGSRLAEQYIIENFLKQTNYGSQQTVLGNLQIEEFCIDQKGQLNQSQQQLQVVERQNNSQNNSLRIIQITRILHSTTLIIVIQIIQDQINKIIEEIQIIINIPCIINDDANNYLKYFTQDHPISSFLNFLKFFIIILYGILLINPFIQLCGIQIKRIIANKE